MLRTTTLTFALLLAAFAAFAAQPLRLSPEYTFADLRVGEPAASAVEQMINVWTTDGQPIVIARYGLFTAKILRARVDPDGTADMGTLRNDVLPNLVAVAPSGDGAVQIWSTPQNTFATRLDPNGDELFSGQPISTGFFTSGQLVCNVVRCLADLGGSSLLLTGDGVFMSGVGVDWNVGAAGDASFLVVQKCLMATPCPVTLIDNSGAIKNSVTPPYEVQDIVFDGTRFVALSEDDNSNVYLTSVNATTGAFSTPTKIVHLAGSLGTMRGRIAWNGTNFGIAALVSPVASGFGGAGPAYVGVMQSDASFSAAELQLITTDTLDETPRITSTEDGFVALWNAASTGRIRTTTVETNGRIVPDPPETVPFLKEAVSQFAETAAASRTAYLGVWTEHGGDEYQLNAARLSRVGARIDSKPILLTHGSIIGPIAASSDGDNFLVVWIDDAENLISSRISASGTVSTVPLDTHVSQLSDLTLTFERGAYQLGVVAPDGVEGISIGTNGNVLLRDRMVLAVDGRVTDVAFDGQRLLAVWTTPLGIRGVVHDTGASASTPFDILPAPNANSFFDVALRGDGKGGYFLLYTNLEGGSATTPEAIIARPLTHDGRVTGTAKTIGRARLAFDLTLLQIGGAWHGAWMDTPSLDSSAQVLVVQPFDGVPLTIPSALYSIFIVPGVEGEALIEYNKSIPEPRLGAASQVAMRVIPGLRPHAVRH